MTGKKTISCHCEGASQAPACLPACLPACGRRRCAEGRRQKAEGRRQKAEGRRQKAQGTRHKADARVGYRDTCIGVCPEVVTGDWRLVRVRVRVRERSRGISCPLLCHVPDNDKQVGPKGPKNLPTARCRSLLAPVQWRSWCCQ
ncbi:hypothetical protein VDGL01_07355 [Verticillium dahliae]